MTRKSSNYYFALMVLYTMSNIPNGVDNSIPRLKNARHIEPKSIGLNHIQEMGGRRYGARVDWDGKPTPRGQFTKHDYSRPETRTERGARFTKAMANRKKSRPYATKACRQLI